MNFSHPLAVVIVGGISGAITGGIVSQLNWQFRHRQKRRDAAADERLEQLRGILKPLSADLADTIVRVRPLVGSNRRTGWMLHRQRETWLAVLEQARGLATADRLDTAIRAVERCCAEKQDCSAEDMLAMLEKAAADVRALMQ